MRAEQYVGAGADRVADRLDHRRRGLDIDQPRLVAVEGGVGTGGVQLHCIETLLDIFQCAGGGHFGIVVDVAPVRRILGMDGAGVRIEIGVGAQLLVHAPAEQLVDRLAGLLADDVPAGHLQRREAAHAGDVGALREPRGVAAAEEVLDLVRIMADEVALRHVFDHAGGDLGAEGGVIGFAVAGDVGIGRQPHEDEILAADARRRIADNPGFYVGDLHGMVPLPGKRRSLTLRSSPLRSRGEVPSEARR